MKHNNKIIESPSILGTGLVCLDIIIKSDTIYHLNGGSCGNVAAGLSFLGWDASVITSCYSDVAGKMLNTNLENIGINQIELGNRASNTPRVIEEIFSHSKDNINHKFSFICSECQKKLPSAKNLTIGSARKLLNNINYFNVLYTDRASPGISLLKKAFRDKGNWTVYEPNSARNIKSFFQNSLTSHIVKFSSDRISFSLADNLRNKASKAITVLIVHTMGKKGLKFCYRKRNGKLSEWQHLNSQPVPNFVDAAGAGDWCTTGILYWMVGNSRKSKTWFTNNEIISAIQYGQALSAISCAFIGGQGLFYESFHDRHSKKLFQDIVKSKRVIQPATLSKSEIHELCHTCLQTKN